MSERKPGNGRGTPAGEGYQPRGNGYQPRGVGTPPPATGGYQPPKGVGGSPTNPKPPAKD